jgi:transcription elongation factor Elf1
MKNFNIKPMALNAGYKASFEYQCPRCGHQVFAEDVFEKDMTVQEMITELKALTLDSMLNNNFNCGLCEE